MSHELKGKFGQVATTPESAPSNWSIGETWLYPAFYYSLIAFAGPGRTDNDLDRFICMARNSSENEPFFMVVASAWMLVDVPEWGPKAVNAYAILRLLHFTFYCLIQKQPFRALAWVGSAVVTMTIAGNILSQTIASSNAAGEL